MSTKKHIGARSTILNEEYAIRSEAPPEHTRAVAEYLDQAIRQSHVERAVVETQPGGVLAALQITGRAVRGARGERGDDRRRCSALSETSAGCCRRQSARRPEQPLTAGVAGAVIAFFTIRRVA